MKLIMILGLAAIVSGGAVAQSAPFDLAAYNLGFDRVQKSGMAVLGSWAAINFLGSGVPLLVSSEAMEEAFVYFLTMNIGWNVVNAALAGAGYWTCCRSAPESYSLAETLKRQYRAEKTFLFNGGLDVGYIAFGLYLIARSNTAASGAMLQGFGYSLIVQGGVLFVFDIAMQIKHAKHRRSLDGYIGSIPGPQ